jgi:hypothetical protein
MVLFFTWVLPDVVSARILIGIGWEGIDQLGLVGIQKGVNKLGARLVCRHWTGNDGMTCFGNAVKFILKRETAKKAKGTCKLWVGGAETTVWCSAQLLKCWELGASIGPGQTEDDWTHVHMHCPAALTH